MKILFVVPSLAQKGPVVVARDIASGLVEMGHDVEVWYLDAKGELKFPCATHKFEWRLIKRLNEFDIIHSHSLRPDALTWLLGFIPGVKPRQVCTIHNYVETDLAFEYGPVVSWCFSRVWRLFWTRRAACVVLTRDALSYYSETQPDMRLSVVHNGRPEHEPSPLPPVDQAVIDDLRKRYRLLGASALVTRRKGFDQVVRALPFLPAFAFCIVGEGPAVEELRLLADELNVAERFVILGFRGNARDFLAHFDVYVMPSHSEGMPLAMIEAANAAKAIVCSDIPVFRELFEGDEVEFFELNNVNELVAAIQQATLNSELLAVKAKARYQKDYSVTAMTQRYLDVYRSCIVGN